MLDLKQEVIDQLVERIAEENDDHVVEEEKGDGFDLYRDD